MAALNHYIFQNKMGRLSSAGPEISAFGSYCSAKVQPILDCFMEKFELRYEDSENIKTHRVDTVVFKLHQIKQRKFFGTPSKCTGSKFT